MGEWYNPHSQRIEASHLAALKEHCSGKVTEMWSNLVEEQHSKFKVILEDLSSKYRTGALQVSKFGMHLPSLI
jgi:hypothetical protein